jgi:predicted HAD superfamily Cof-like phosphohydrolase
MSNATDIRKFMEIAGQATRMTPTADIPDQERLLRAKLVLSEALEFVAAMGCDLVYVEKASNPPRLYNMDCVLAPGKQIDLIEAADACADLRYVVIGSEITLGIPGDDVFDEVHRSNMTKFVWVDNVFDPHPVAQLDTHGKVMKPSTYDPPNIAEVLRADGWEG